MGQKEEIYRWMNFKPCTIKEIHQKFSQYSEAHVTQLVTRLVQEGKLKKVDNNGKKAQYQKDNSVKYEFYPPDGKSEVYTDFHIDSQAITMAGQMLERQIYKFFSKKKMKSCYLGQISVFRQFGEETEIEQIEYKALEIIKSLFEVSKMPAISLLVEETNDSSLDDYYFTKFSNIFWCKQGANFYLTRFVPSISLATNKIGLGPLSYEEESKSKFEFYTPEELKKYRKEKDEFEEKLKNSKPSELLFNIFHSEITPEYQKHYKILRDGEYWYFSPFKGLKIIGKEIRVIGYNPNDAALSRRYEAIFFDIFKLEKIPGDNLLRIIKDHKYHKIYAFYSSLLTDFIWKGFQISPKELDEMQENKNYLNLILKKYSLPDYSTITIDIEQYEKCTQWEDY
ncbi:hypothetical protein DSAG12_00612 [Promethearchaeum syntrophicum]|uniref:Uncharacterized protein n=1 Tax=Promethearchaeum syntrophicum TaxID=2594042 RepID=A0A5B9D717_9ARCH|nr:hypothetical protein [Candidatus Prometheoarchaeum syntrophicum]QEE14795.1 hypothetical protein DSAG12_00612 [Candidatus Prometheoarchaeum syntrophicum]